MCRSRPGSEWKESIGVERVERVERVQIIEASVAIAVIAVRTPRYTDVVIVGVRFVSMPVVQLQVRGQGLSDESSVHVELCPWRGRSPVPGVCRVCGVCGVCVRTV